MTGTQWTRWMLGAVLGAGLGLVLLGGQTLLRLAAPGRFAVVAAQDQGVVAHGDQVGVTVLAAGSGTGTLSWPPYVQPSDAGRAATVLVVQACVLANGACPMADVQGATALPVTTTSVPYTQAPGSVTCFQVLASNGLYRSPPSPTACTPTAAPDAASGPLILIAR
jgi:hypothetical protein